MTVRPSPPFRDFEVSAILREVAEVDDLLRQREGGR